MNIYWLYSINGGKQGANDCEVEQWQEAKAVGGECRRGADVLTKPGVEVREFCLSQEADLSNQNKQLLSAHFSSSY